MLFLILAVVIIIIAYLKSLDKNTRAYYNKNIKRTSYEELIFGEQHISMGGCVACKTLYGCCPIDNKYKCPKANFTVDDCPATLKDYYNYLR